MSKMMALGEIINYEQPSKYIVESTAYDDAYVTPVLTAGQSFILGKTNETENIYTNLPCVIFDDFTTAIKFVDFPFKVKSSAMKILTADKETSDIKYLFYKMSTINIDTVLHKRYWISNYAHIQIPLPPLPEQRKIAAILDKASGLIALRKQQIEQLDLMVKSRFVEMFSDPFLNSNFYEFIPFEQFMERCVDIGSNGANKVVADNLNMKDAEDYALLVRTLNFTANDFTNNVKYISKESYDFFKKSKVYGGEIIFNKIGSAGINFIMPNLNRPVSLGLNQIMITPKNINTQYLYFYLSTNYGKHQINSRVQGAVTKSIQKTEIKRIPIMSPPLPLQKQFADFVHQVEKTKSEMQQGLGKLELQYNALMQQYFGQ